MQFPQLKIERLKQRLATLEAAMARLEEGSSDKVYFDARWQFLHRSYLNTLSQLSQVRYSPRYEIA